MEGSCDAFLSFHECLAQKLPQDRVGSGKRIAVWPSEAVLPLGAAGYVSATQGPQNRDLVQKEAAQGWPWKQPIEESAKFHPWFFLASPSFCTNQQNQLAFSPPSVTWLEG